MYRVRGMGDASTDASPNLAVRCAGYSLMSYLVSPPCWSHTRDDWKTLATLPLPPVPAPPAGPATVQQETEPGAWTPDQAISQSVQDAQAQAIDFFKRVPMLPTDTGGSPVAGLSLTALIALGIVAGGAVLILTSGRGRR